MDTLLSHAQITSQNSEGTPLQISRALLLFNTLLRPILVCLTSLNSHLSFLSSLRYTGSVWVLPPSTVAYKLPSANRLWCGAHFVCMPSVGNYCPALLSVQCLRTVDVYFLFCFLVVLRWSLKSGPFKLHPC